MPPNRSSGKKSLVVGVTGASGAVFARRTLQMLEADQRVDKIHLVVSGSGMKLLRDELDLEVSKRNLVVSGSGMKLLRDELDLEVSKSAEIPSRLLGKPARKTVYLLDSDIGATIASGSYPVDGMVVIPCTTGCLGQIANGISSTLIEKVDGLPGGLP